MRAQRIRVGAAMPLMSMFRKKQKTREEEMQLAIRSSSPSRLPVSVCMATYNGERFVHRQLESILRQLDAEDEVVIVDDCSQDSTLTVVRNLQDSRIRLFEHAENRGPTAAFETALRHARHELICFSDQDDVWLPGKIAHLQTVFENPDVKFAVHDCAVTDGNLKVVEPSYFRWRKVKGGLLRNFAVPGLVGCCMAFRRSLLPIVLPFPSDRRLLHDVWISTAAQVSRVTPVLIPQSLLLFVRHGENASQIDLASRRRTLTRIASERWALLAQLTKHKLFAKRRRDIDRRKGSRLLAE